MSTAVIVALAVLWLFLGLGCYAYLNRKQDGSAILAAMDITFTGAILGVLIAPFLLVYYLLRGRLPGPSDE